LADGDKIAFDERLSVLIIFKKTNVGGMLLPDISVSEVLTFTENWQGSDGLTMIIGEDFGSINEISKSPGGRPSVIMPGLKGS
jgi:hypothetical protein